MDLKQKRLIKTILLFAVIILAVYFLQEFVVMPWQPRDVQIAGFYKEDRDSLDVVFIGASDMYTAFSPALAYEEYGFTSYPFAPPRNSVGVWSLQVDEILRTQSPRVIVIEVNGALYTEEDELVTEENLRLFTDHIPLSRQKMELIDRYAAGKDKINYYIPYLKYHGNITSLSSAADTLYERLSFEGRGGLYMKGERNHFSTAKFENEIMDLKDDNEQIALEPMHESALRSFLEYCLENADCPILFIRAPHYVTEEEEVTAEFFHRTNRVENIIEDYGFEFINFDKMHDELKLNYDDDFYNSEHLNYRGRKKFTEFFGNVLAQKYNIKDIEHPTGVTKTWNRAAIFYDEYIKQGEKLEDNKASAAQLEFFEAESQALLNRLKDGL